MNPSTAISIIACDPEKNQWGAALYAHLLAAGATIPWVQEGTGALVTQALDNAAFGPQGLKLLSQGCSAQETIEGLVKKDNHYRNRQLGIVDHHGITAAYTGDHCPPWAGHLTGPYYSCQGTRLQGEEVLHRMGAAFNHTQGDLADRLLEALKAAQAIQGEFPGQNAAALIIKGEKDQNPASSLSLDLRVDDHGEPLQELERLLSLHRLTFPLYHRHHYYQFRRKIQDLFSTFPLPILNKEREGMTPTRFTHLCQEYSIPVEPFGGQLINGQAVYLLYEEGKKRAGLQGREKETP